VADPPRHLPDAEQGDHWERLEAFLRTDPRDVGCDLTMDLLDVYAELLAGGDDPTRRFPGLQAHLRACGPCGEALHGLLEALRADPPI
jgi:hypothetical protein